MKCIVGEQDLDGNLIIERIFLQQMGLNASFREAEISQHGKDVPSHPCNHFKDNQIVQKVLTNESCSTMEACVGIFEKNWLIATLSERRVVSHQAGEKSKNSVNPVES